MESCCVKTTLSLGDFKFMRFRALPSLSNAPKLTIGQTHCPRRAPNFPTRTIYKSFPSISAVLSLSGVKDVENSPSSSEFEGISVVNYGVDEPRKLKVGVEISGATTQEIFDKVFNKMVADAQPIPGFRRVKGGKTPDIPKHILLEVLGRSKVLKQVIQRIINTATADYVVKEGLKVSQDIRVEQSFEDLESEFEAGETFSFDVVLELQETN